MPALLKCNARPGVALVRHSSAWGVMFFFCYQGGRTPTGWPHTAQSGEPDCRGPEAKPHQRDTPNTPIPGGAQCPDQNSMGVEPTHLLGVLQRLPAQRNHAHPTSISVMFQCLWCHVAGQVSHGQFLLLVVSYHQLLLLAYLCKHQLGMFGHLPAAWADQYSDAAIKDWQRRMVCCAGVFFPWLSCQVAALVWLTVLIVCLGKYKSVDICYPSPCVASWLNTGVKGCQPRLHGCWSCRGFLSWLISGLFVGGCLDSEQCSKQANNRTSTRPASTYRHC